MATPMKPSGAPRPKPADGLVALAVLLLAAALAFAAWGNPSGGDFAAAISVDGTVTERIALSRLAGDQERTITAGGYTLHLRLSSGGVEMAAADCPTQDCVHTGRISRPGQSIVCLPARVSVTLAGTAADGVDAVLG